MYEIFAQLCKQHGVTPYKVSKETGVSQPTLSEWKKGTYTPKQDKLQKIADYFGVTLDYLMGNTHADEQTPPEKQKAPTLNKKDERDIAKTLEQLRETLENEEGLMFYGDPMSNEAKESILAAMKLGVQAAKLKNKEKYTPKKYKKD
ncbi:MAG: helix-turn-helix transcriptional regulator [Negativibacillus sp.]|nr:helix-turn-helix transcriptional regulator [Negativibacillus sp.]